MSIWILISLIALYWLSYPIFGAIGVAAAVSRGERPEDAGFSFMPELIVFPPVFFGFAMAIDHVALPWGRWIVSGFCVLLFVWSMVASIISIARIHKAKNVE